MPAYPYYTPPGVAYPYAYQYNNQQSQQMGQYQQQAQQNASNGVFWCHGLAEAERWQVVPGNAVAIMDIDAPVLYIRSCDNTGKPSTQIYDLHQRTGRPPEPAPAAAPDMSDYVRRSEFNDLAAKIAALTQKEEAHESAV